MKRHINNQHGAVLITGLLILVILSLFGLTVMQGSALQEKMAGNLEQQNIAFQAAESGLRKIEEEMGNYATLPSFSGTNGLYQPADAGETPIWQSIDWTNSAQCIVYQELDVSEDPPLPEIRCIAEYLAEIENTATDTIELQTVSTTKDMLRMTCRGLSTNERSAVMLQTTYLR